MADPELQLLDFSKPVQLITETTEQRARFPTIPVFNLETLQGILLRIGQIEDTIKIDLTTWKNDMATLKDDVEDIKERRYSIKGRRHRNENRAYGHEKRHRNPSSRYNSSSKDAPERTASYTSPLMMPPGVAPFQVTKQDIMSYDGLWRLTRRMQRTGETFGSSWPPTQPILGSTKQQLADCLGFF
ncbi:hypothetical protein M422DRAFT_260199 [Sphaerobolus stellatus SS14]|uniref:Unplaced genomic scaffold SPHSTscaffold_95, whole genome shotgun sequence n=1 Tax=Sphaerobolus stellatus (strain SS14) TaxID=990650 RepID=A0A0C9UR66_SPHS4|nr:hypothetical protein M422DRAFT_260199 [Sphaerobolus stellatus SS14]